MTLSNEDSRRLMERLAAPTYAQLLGVEAHLLHLAALLTDPSGPQIVAIEGVHGIGKSSLAHSVLHHLIKTEVISLSTAGNASEARKYAGCLWITASSHMPSMAPIHRSLLDVSWSGAGLVQGIAAQLFAEEGCPIGLEPPQLRSMVSQRLAQEPHLIVIDELETLTAQPLSERPNSPHVNGVSRNNAGDVENSNIPSDCLFETMEQLGNPSRFLLTTQLGIIDRPEIHCHTLNPLGRADALGLIRAEAEHRNRGELVQASDKELHAIYQAVGGNPLALRLMACQPYAPALHSILADLAAAQGKPIENLYTYIYQHIWNHLDEAVREAWLLMPIVAREGNGMALTDLADIAQQEPAVLYQTLEQLVTRNLIHRVGEMPNCRYSIHSLARSFLLDQLLNWGKVTE